MGEGFDDDDRAGGVGGHVLADRAEQRPQDPPVPAGADHQQFGALGLLHQHLGGVPLDGRGGHGDLTVRGARVGQGRHQDPFGGDHRMEVADRGHVAEG
jgi:hypothetical protein